MHLLRTLTIKSKQLLLYIISVIAFGIQGCTPSPIIPTTDSFSDGYHTTSASMHCYLSYLTDQIEVLEFSSMKSGSLCSKPNCNHTSNNCIMYKLSGNVPIINEGYAYYFADDEPMYYQNDDGKPDLKLGTALYCFDLKKNKETLLLHLADYSVSSIYGWLLHDGVIYFVGNEYSRYYDENDIMLGFGGTGGNMGLHSVRLSDGKVKDYGSLYNIDELSKYYPKAPNSGEVYMAGLFENKIYFNVGFVEDDETDPTGFNYRFYVTYYDLDTGTYHGEPEDYTNIDFAFVRFLSTDYLAICRDGQVTVYRKGQEKPIVLTGDCFYQEQRLCIFDDILICSGNAYDLNTGSVTALHNMENKLVLARFEDEYIISESGGQAGFEKIPVTNLLPE